MKPAALAGLILTPTLLLGACAAGTVLTVTAASAPDLTVADPSGCFDSAVPDVQAVGQPGQTAAGLDAEQTSNVQVIIAEGKRRGLPPQAWVIAVATARQESGLRNLPGGDGSSVGLFQLIQSHGSKAQRQNPLFSTRWFYDGLQAVPGWQVLPVTVAAQRVQRSAYPLAYAKWEGFARTTVAALADATDGAAVLAGAPSVTCSLPVVGDTCPVSPLSATLERGLVPESVTLSRCLYQAFGTSPFRGSVGGYAPGRGHVKNSDHYTGRAVDWGVRQWETGAGRPYGDQIAAWVVANADRFDVKYVIWNSRWWLPDGKGWRAYQHPCRCNDPNLQHRNHVHVSVKGLRL